MADYNSSLPVKTENNGDVVVKVGDGTTPSQQLSVDSSGRVTTKLNDGSGNAVTSQVNGAQRALDVGIDVAGVQVDPRQIRTLTSTDVVTANIKDSSGTSITLGQKVSASSLPVVIASDQSSISVTDVADGSVTGGTAGTKSLLVGGVFNTSLPTITNSQQAAVQLDSSARVIIAPLTNTSIIKSQLQDNSGNGLTSSAAGGTRPLDVALRDGSGNLYTNTNPIPVYVAADNPGTEINDYNTVASVAAAATSNHDYTVSVGKTLYLDQINASGSGKLKIEVQIETGAATGTFSSKFVNFNSTATPNLNITLQSPITVATGVRVRIIRTNKDNQAQDVYSTISGQEI